MDLLGYNLFVSTGGSVYIIIAIMSNKGIERVRSLKEISDSRIGARQTQYDSEKFVTI